MPKEGRRTNPVKLRAGMTIGSVSAETDDEFLFDCFVQHPAVDVAGDLKAAGMILAGRTGSGKTAIIRFLERNLEHVVQIDPSEMALSYVSNSDVLRFLHQIGADLDLLFQVLWKHVLCIEFIRLRFETSDQERSQNFLSRVLEKFSRDTRRSKSIAYLREWEGKFWITMDRNIKEITEKYESKLEAELGGEVSKFKARGQYEKQLSNEKKAELVTRARKIINAEQLAELAGVIDILAEMAADDRMSKYCIFIDKLDERWVDDSVRFRLVRALIESLRAFRRITNLKILVSLRSDILERVVQETADLGFQREKYEDYFIRLKWRKTQLRELVEKRIRHLFERKYTTEEISFGDVFTHNVGQADPFEYIIERTLLRPRDVIVFVNECLARADGHFEVGARFIREAESEYSRIRRQALEQEWQSAFPTLPMLLSSIASQRAVIGFSELLDTDVVADLVLSICTNSSLVKDPLFQIASAVVGGNDDVSEIDFAKEMVSILYRVGAIGVKLQPSERFLYSHIDQPVISTAVIGDATRLRVHPMLHRTLNIQMNDGRFSSQFSCRVHCVVFQIISKGSRPGRPNEVPQFRRVLPVLWPISPLRSRHRVSRVGDITFGLVILECSRPSYTPSLTRTCRTSCRCRCAPG